MSNLFDDDIEILNAEIQKAQVVDTEEQVAKMAMASDAEIDSNKRALVFSSIKKENSILEQTTIQISDYYQDSDIIYKGANNNIKICDYKNSIGTQQQITTGITSKPYTWADKPAGGSITPLDGYGPPIPMVLPTETATIVPIEGALMGSGGTVTTTLGSDDCLIGGLIDAPPADIGVGIGIGLGSVDVPGWEATATPAEIPSWLGEILGDSAGSILPGPVGSGVTPSWAPPLVGMKIDETPPFDKIIKSAKVERKVNTVRRSIKTQYIDTNLIKGSSDRFRNRFGAYYNLKTISAPDNVFYEFESFKPRTPRDIRISDNRQGHMIGPGGTPASPAQLSPFGGIYFGPKTMSKLNGKALKNLYTPILLVSKPVVGDGDHMIENDEHWRKYIIGGTYMGIKYPGIIPQGYSEDQVFTCSKPYELQHLRGIAKEELFAHDYIELKSFSNYELPAYNRYTNSKIDELLIPNFYSMVKHNLITDVPLAAAPPEPYTTVFYNIKNIYKGKIINEPVLTAFPPPEEFKKIDVLPIPMTVGDYHYVDRNRTIKNYLNTFVEAKHPTNKKNTIVKNNINIMFPYGIDPQLNKLKKYVPYYNSIKIPLRNEYHRKIYSDSTHDTYFKNLINNNIHGSYRQEWGRSTQSSLICNMLKKNFIDKDVVDGLEVKNFVVNNETNVLTDTAPSVVQTHRTVGEANLKYIDMFEALTAEFNFELPDRQDIINASIIPATKGEYYGKLFFDSIMIGDDDPAYRHQKKIDSLRSIHKMMSVLNSNSYSHNICGFPTWEEAKAKYLPVDFLNKAGNERYSEPIGYRIEKLSSNKLTSERKPAPVQNIFILKNRLEPDNASGYQHNLEYIDTQIKKGLTYTYNVYEYRIVLGYKYKFSNPLVTRKIDKPYLSDEKVPKGKEAPKLYCLEYYDPMTIKSAASLFDTVKKYKPEESKYDTMSQTISPFPYQAQLDLQLEPVYRIYQIPLVTKEVTNTDHPPHALEINPYHRKDDSQIIGFHLLKENFSFFDFPTGLNDAENITIKKYLNSQNLVPGDRVIKDGVSKNRFIEIYRINKKPDSIEDFNGKLINTKDLILDKESPDLSVYTDCFYEEKIKTNTKFYYTFRVINSEGVKGEFSPIYEAELIDDGNYKYAVFEKTELKQLGPPRMIDKTNRTVKKLMQILPSPEQMVLSDKDVNYKKAAESQIDKIIVGPRKESIWDKKFKFRLTSKKTGKKIDLNITYKIRN